MSLKKFRPKEELAKLAFIRTIFSALERKQAFLKANFFWDLKMTLEKIFILIQRKLRTTKMLVNVVEIGILNVSPNILFIVP